MTDKKGRQVYPGDLIKSYHFTDRKKKKYYLYHTVVEENGYLQLVPTQYLDSRYVNQGGKCNCTQNTLDNIQAEIIFGYGPDGNFPYDEREKNGISYKR